MNPFHDVEALTREYRRILSPFQAAASDLDVHARVEVCRALLIANGWTEQTADAILNLLKEHEPFILRNAVAMGDALRLAEPLQA